MFGVEENVVFENDLVILLCDNFPVHFRIHKTFFYYDDNLVIL